MDSMGHSLRLQRRQAALNAIRDRGPIGCVVCGETRPFALHSREGHHIAGKANDSDLTGNICFNCHAAVHEDLRTLEVPMRYKDGPTPIQRLVSLLLSVGSLLQDIGERLIAWAALMSSLVELNPNLIVPNWNPGVS